MFTYMYFSVFVHQVARPVLAVVLRPVLVFLSLFCRRLFSVLCKEFTSRFHS